jgi:tRNA G18 (ribose-2'-O)-methylase SpoU
MGRRLKKLTRRLIRGRQIARKNYTRQRLLNRLAEPGPHAGIIVLDHLKPHFNVGKIFRSADAFGMREIHLVGIDYFDPGPAMGSFKWVPACFHDSFADCYQALRARGYRLFATEPAAGRTLGRCALPEKSAFVFGNEGVGLSFDPARYDGIELVKIPQWGKVQSLNVSVAASLVMFEYVRQHQLTGIAGPDPEKP